MNAKKVLSVAVVAAFLLSSVSCCHWPFWCHHHGGYGGYAPYSYYGGHGGHHGGYHGGHHGGHHGHHR